MTLRDKPAWLFAGILFLACFGLMSACDESPTGTNASVPMEGGGTIDPGAGNRFLLSTVDLGPDFRGHVEVWAYNLAIESDSIVGFDLVLVNGTNGDIPPPLQFVITSIVPRSVECFNPDGYMRERLPFYDFSDDMGDDGRFTPGEATAPVHVRFRWSEPTAFSIGFRLVIGEVIPHGVIGGVVFEDLDGNGVYEDAERGIAGVAVELRKPSEDSASTGGAIVVHTDPLGRYAFSGLSEGVHRVEALLPPGAAPTTPNPLLVALVVLPDGTVSSFLKAHFGVSPLLPPPPEFVFGPVPVGPASPNGTRVDSTFTIGPPMPPFPPQGDLYYVRIEPPPVMGPLPMFIGKIAVTLDGQVVYKFECPPDTLCPAFFDRVPIDPALTVPGEHEISIGVMGSEFSFLLVGIEHGVLRGDGTDGQ